MLRQILAPLASLRLTVALLAITSVLVFVGTSVQKEMGIWDVQHRFFHSFAVWVPLRLFTPLWGWGFTRIPFGIPWPGGYTLIALLLANLLAAHTVRFKLTKKRIGIIVIHAGLILLILGELVTSLFAHEGRMPIEEGQSVSYVEDTRAAELAIIDATSPDHDDVIAIPASKLVNGATISYPTLPFSLHVDQFAENSSLLGPEQARQMGHQPDSHATIGTGQQLTMIPEPKVNGIGRSIDAPSAYITLTHDGAPLATVLCSTYLPHPERFQLEGRDYEVALRWKRSYRPYTITLKKFTHDIYDGSNTPRNFASQIHLDDPSHGENRNVKIWMNHPLRYEGDTFFQADWNHETEAGTVLQVVRNPGWLIPYISCALVALGLVVHFGMNLLTFLRRRIGAPFDRGNIAPPLAAATACVLAIALAGRAPRQTTEFNLNNFGRIAVNYEGRVMPLDTLATIGLRVISGRSDLHLDDDTTKPAIDWLADVMAKPQHANSYKIFRIDHPDVLDLLSLDPNAKFFSFDNLLPKFDALVEQADHIAKDVTSENRTLFQRKVMELSEKVAMYQMLQDWAARVSFAPPVRADQKWSSIESVAERDVLERAAGHEPAMNPAVPVFSAIASAYSENRPADFNSNVDGYLLWLRQRLPDVSQKTDYEVLFNYFAPFYTAMPFYVLVFLTVCASWLIAPWRTTLQRTALWILVTTLAFHTLGLAARIYIQGRPPVTNLYSSAIFIGWAACVFCAVLERIYRNGIGSAAASIIAFPTLIIAHTLAGSGDTMAPLQAVLDTNIWLATHVVVVTLGYTATFLAGGIALIYVIASIVHRLRGNDDTEFRATMAKIVYGVLCFALLFSFVGTVLGGIWADQSWGRFWGWDPKENGAVLIVLWNAIVLHSRWAGIVKLRGLMLLAIAGNIVTAWSWFGTNLMGVGLHSYGFMDSGTFWLGLFCASQLLVIGLGLMLPSRATTSRITTVG